MSTDDVLSPAATLATTNSPVTQHGKTTMAGDEGPCTPKGVQLGGSRDNARFTPDGQDTPKWGAVLAQYEAQQKAAALKQRQRWCDPRLVSRQLRCLKGEGVGHECGCGSSRVEAKQGVGLWPCQVSRNHNG